MATKRKIKPKDKAVVDHVLSVVDDVGGEFRSHTVLSGKVGDIGVDMVNGNPLVTFAAVIPSRMDSGREYLDQVAEYSNVSEEGKDDLCWKLYENEGIVGSAIDSMIALCITAGFVKNCKNKDLKKILDYWVANVNGFNSEESVAKIETAKSDVGIVSSDSGLLSVCANAFLNQLVTGDAILLENWAKDVEVPGYSKSLTLPITVNVLDVRQVDFDDDMAMFGQEQLSYKINDEIKSIVKSGKKDGRYATVERFLSPDIINQIKKGADSILLPNILTTHFKRLGIGRTRGRSWLQRAFPAIAQKKRLQALDAATIAGMIQRLTILMVGHENPASPFHSPAAGRVAVLKNAIQKLPTNKMLLWSGPDLQVIDIGPDGKILSFENRFNEVDDSISLALGFPRILIDGASSGTSSRDWVVILKTINMLEQFRDVLKKRIEKWFRFIAIKNGFEEEVPLWSWSLMSLKDERTARTLIMKAYEDGLIGRGDAIEFLGWNSDDVITRHIQEGIDKLNEQIPLPLISFSKQGASATNPNTGGRPPGSEDDVDVDRAAASRIRAMALGGVSAFDFEYESLLSVYRGVQIAVRENVTVPVKTVVAAGMMYYASEVGRYANNAFSFLTREDVGDKSMWSLRLQAWVSDFIEKFKGRVLEYISSNDLPDDEIELRDAVASYLVSQEYRVKKTVDAIRVKVELADSLMGYEARMVKNVKYRAGSTECDVCKKADGRVMTTSEAFAEFPLHPGCVSCTLEPIEG